MARYGGTIPPTFRPAMEAFGDAIKEGRLSEDPKAPNHAGWYMYMGHFQGKDQFKNATTRQYLA